MAKQKPKTVTRKTYEMKFLTGLKKDFARDGHYFYKIPDAPSSIRFMVSRPFDCFIGINGELGGMEAKYLDASESVSVLHSQVRESQHHGLRDIISKGGQGWVFYQIKYGSELRLYFWEYQDFLRLLDKHSENNVKKIPLSIVEGWEHVLGRKNRFDVLEYDLRTFVEAWEMIGELYGA